MTQRKESVKGCVKEVKTSRPASTMEPATKSRGSMVFSFLEPRLLASGVAII